MNTYLNYKKPDIICQDNSIWKEYIESGNFTENVKKHIEGIVAEQGFQLRLAVNDDILNIEKLIAKCYPPKALRDSNPYDFYRFINFGHGLVVEDTEKTIIGCLFEEAYDTHERTSYSLRLAIDKDAKTKDLGTLLVEYSTMLAIEHGSRIKRGLLMTNNFISAHILINKLGWICDDFYPDLRWVTPSFTISVPLSIENFAFSRIDQNKLVNYLSSSRNGIDYSLIDWDDTEGFKKLYSEKRFIICALLRPGQFQNGKYQYVAMPFESVIKK